jgi:hypothetical protein
MTPADQSSPHAKTLARATLWADVYGLLLEDIRRNRAARLAVQNLPSDVQHDDRADGAQPGRTDDAPTMGGNR